VLRKEPGSTRSSAIVETARVTNNDNISDSGITASHNCNTEYDLRNGKMNLSKRGILYGVMLREQHGKLFQKQA